jgi:AcrR family transcriptional regulator
MVRQKVEVRREAILAATIEQIEARGMATVRVADVAAALGVSTGLIFYHFDTKNALIVEALGYAVERDLSRLDRALSRSLAAPDRLKRVLSSYGPTGSAPSWTLWIDAWATALREPTVRSALRRLDDRWRAALVGAVSDGVAAGDFVCADPRAAVARIGALLDGLSVAVLVYRTVTRGQLRQWVREATAAELGLDPAVLA